MTAPPSDTQPSTGVTYEQFLRRKVDFDRSCGFGVGDQDVHPLLKPHQRAIVRWAVHGGRRAIFAAFGLGKSVIQLETLRLVLTRADRLITRYTNPNELVYDPFGGLMTVPLRALTLGRRGRAVELNPDYFLDGVKYLQAHQHHTHLPTLFDLDNDEDIPA